MSALPLSPEPGEAEPTRAPWTENPYRLVSLEELMEIVRAYDPLGLYLMVEEFKNRIVGGEADETAPKAMSSVLGELEKLCRRLNLSTALVKIDEIRFYLDEYGALDELEDQVKALFEIYRSELKTKNLLHIPASRVSFYSDPTFGGEVEARFPSAGRDIEEAGRCFALGMWTACAFHLMRALEVSLNALAKSINVAPEENWNKLLNKIDAELRNILKRDPKPPGWKDDEPFYAAASAHFRDIKNAYRNKISHAGVFLDERLAQRLWDASRAFMEHLATRLSE